MYIMGNRSPRRRLSIPATPSEKLVGTGALNPEDEADAQILLLEQASDFASIYALAHQAISGFPGVKEDAIWPRPRQQKGLSCQSVAVVNGIRCWQAFRGLELWDPTDEEIDSIRADAATEFDGKEGLTYLARSVGNLLVARGELKDCGGTRNPPRAVSMMGQGGFVVDVDSRDWHATTIVPNMLRLADSSGNVPGLIRIDPLGGAQTAMSVEEFCSILFRPYPNPITGRQDDAPLMRVPDVTVGQGVPYSTPS